MEKTRRIEKGLSKNKQKEKKLRYRMQVCTKFADVTLTINKNTYIKM